MDIPRRKTKEKARPSEKSIRFPVNVHEKLLKLALKLGKSQVQLFTEMVEYFYRTKKDPTDINDDLLKNTLFKNHDTYIRFIRAQEDALLIPIKNNVDRMIGNQRELISYFNSQVLQANKTIQRSQDEQVKNLKEVVDSIQVLKSKAEDKEKLKVKFLHILNTYIKARENLGTFTGNREKDELAKAFRQQVIIL